MKYLKSIILSLAICSSAVVGDFIVFKSRYSDSLVFRALADSAVHATMGLLSSLLFFSHGINISSEAYIYNVIFCTGMSSFIDVDHFIVAKSIYLKDLTNLKQRGIFHCATFWIIVTFLLLIYSYVKRKFNIYLLTYMLILAFTSHLIRDANRRGLWFYPFGHTPALNKILYIFLIMLLPNIFFYTFDFMKPVNKQIIVYKELV